LKVALVVRFSELAWPLVNCIYETPVV